MIHILVCCEGGLSSGFMTKKVIKELHEKGYENLMTIEFCGFRSSYERWDHIDVVMCCPHLDYRIPGFIAEHGNKIPYYTIPSRMYGIMNIEDVYQDAKDIIAAYKENPKVPFTFPGEEVHHKIQRTHSYRREVLHEKNTKD